MKYLLLLSLLLIASSAQAQIPLGPVESADDSAARIMVYFAVGRDDTPHNSVTLEQFKSHLAELKAGGYTVMTMEAIIKAYRDKTALPDNAVAITFDGGDKSVLTHAAPLLEEYGFPYTVFISTGFADTNYPNHLNWRDIKKLHKTSLATFGLHPESYTHLSGNPEETIRSSLNNATVRFRNELGYNPMFFAYPFGEYDQAYYNIISSYGFLAAFGQQSGVAHNEADLFALPRFTMTENYANLNRFQMTAQALPLPVEELTPAFSTLKDLHPSIGFTVPGLAGKLDRLSCFAAGQDKPDLNIIGQNRVEIRLQKPIDETRFRLNCTLPVKTAKDTETERWRWFGTLYTVDETLLGPQNQTSDMTENNMENDVPDPDGENQNSGDSVGRTSNTSGT